jgi:hypothetical protein
MLRETRDGIPVLGAPLSTRDSSTRLILEFCAMLAIVGAALVAEGFHLSVPVQSVEDTDAPRSEQP